MVDENTQSKFAVGLLFSGFLDAVNVLHSSLCSLNELTATNETLTAPQGWIKHFLTLNLKLTWIMVIFITENVLTQKKRLNHNYYFFLLKGKNSDQLPVIIQAQWYNSKKKIDIYTSVVSVVITIIAMCITERH